MKFKDWCLKYLSGLTIILGILLLLLSIFIYELNYTGWLLIIFGSILFVLDLTLFRYLDL